MELETRDYQTVRNILHHYQDDSGRLRAIRYLRGFVGVESFAKAKRCVADIAAFEPWTKPEITYQPDPGPIHVVISLDKPSKGDDFVMCSSLAL